MDGSRIKAVQNVLYQCHPLNWRKLHGLFTQCFCGLRHDWLQREDGLNGNEYTAMGGFAPTRGAWSRHAAQVNDKKWIYRLLHMRKQL